MSTETRLTGPNRYRLDRRANPSDRLPRVELLPAPSALEFLPRLSTHLGRRIYVKRDDEGGRGGGGNKLRKFERQFADALGQGADTVIIAGHPQSNAARELAGSAARLGLRTIVATKELVARDTPAMRESGNALLLDLLGAELIPIAADEAFDEAIERIATRLRAQGAHPYVLPFGASDPRGALGYADCADEILQQMRDCEGREPDIIVLATGSGGTQAGLVAGVTRARRDTKVIGFTVLKPAEEVAREVERLAQATLMLDGLDPPLAAIEVDGRARGEGYGLPTVAALEAVRLMARLEGLFLCPVYTGKALAGLIDYLDTEPVADDALIVFVHTGGLPFLFAYPDAFGSAR